MTIKADHPAFMMVVDLNQVRDDVDKAIDCLEENSSTSSIGAASRIRLAQQTLAKVSENISLHIARGQIK